MELKHITEADLIVENMPLRDRINTKLMLLDYDWMTYALETEFRTKNQGILKVQFNYIGVSTSEMKVIRKKNAREEKYTFEFDADIFEKYIISFLKRHLLQWENKEVFNGGDIVLSFYNEILEKGKQI